MRASWDAALTIQDNYSLTGDRFHHLVNVTRIRINEELLLLNGKGLKVFTRVESMTKRELRLTFISKEFSEPKFFMDLVLGIPKKDAFDLCLKQVTELGFRRIYLVRSQFSQNKVSEPERIQNVLVSALEQSNSAFLPEIIEAQWSDIPWEEYPLSLMMDSQTESRQNNDHKTVSPCLLIVGPEGGFSPQEIEELHRKPGMEVVRLPTPILRTPTAVATGAGIILGRLLK